MLLSNLRRLIADYTTDDEIYLFCFFFIEHQYLFYETGISYD